MKIQFTPLYCVVLHFRYLKCFFLFFEGEGDDAEDEIGEGMNHNFVFINNKFSLYVFEY